jgi:hypothetical protein
VFENAPQELLVWAAVTGWKVGRDLGHRIAGA